MVASQVDIEDRPLTIEDLEAMPDDGQRYELLQGELIVSPSPGGAHQEILGELFVLLHGAAQRGQSGKAILAPFDVQLTPHDVVQPDLFFFRHSQASQYSDRRFLGAPAFVIEIVSPSSGHYDRIRKASLYAAFGVEEYWVVDPRRQRILVHDPASGEPSPRMVTTGTLASRVVPTFSIDLAEIFAIGPRE